MLSDFEVSDIGTKIYRRNGKLHREGGPAYEWANGAKFWFFDGQRHRTDGPAYEGVDGSVEWWFNNDRYDSPDEMPLSLFLAYCRWEREKLTRK